MNGKVELEAKATIHIVAINKKSVEVISQVEGQAAVRRTLHVNENLNFTLRLEYDQS